MPHSDLYLMTHLRLRMGCWGRAAEEAGGCCCESWALMVKEACLVLAEDETCAQFQRVVNALAQLDE